ncbi:MAG: hypothetical protein RLY43_1128 [Bacteroidota bacterium]
MKRDFSNESFLNFLLRFLRSLDIRFRGYFFRNFGMFSDNKCSGLCIGIHPKFINSKGIKFGKNVALGNFPRLECYNVNLNSAKLEIGDETTFGDYLHIGTISNIFIGKGVLGGSNILIIDHNHGNSTKEELMDSQIIPRERLISSKGGIIIEDNVWIGDDVKILGSVNIGRGSVIAANSIITKDVAPYTVFIKK